MRSVAVLGLSGLLAATLPLAAQAAEQCGPDAMRDHPPQVNFRVDNDLFGGRHQDQGYTNGAQLTLVSPNLVDYTDDPCLPRMARWVNQYLEGLHPGRFEQQNMIFSIGQGIFTPTDQIGRAHV